MRDIAALLSSKPTSASRELNKRMNAIILEYDKRLVNEWHPRRPRRTWPQGISK